MDRPNRVAEDMARLYCPFYNYKTTPHAIVAKGNVSSHWHSDLPVSNQANGVGMDARHANTQTIQNE
jgi:hypothetical protein